MEYSLVSGSLLIVPDSLGAISSDRMTEPQVYRYGTVCDSLAEQALGKLARLCMSDGGRRGGASRCER